MVLKNQPEVADMMYTDLELTERLVNDSIKMLKEWLYMQPHLPHITDDNRLKRIFLLCKGRMEIAKTAVDMYFTLRTIIPEVLSNRDPLAQWFQDLSDRILVVTLPDYTENFYRVTIISATRPPPDIKTFDLLDIMKMFFMAQDVRLAEDMSLGDIIIVDVQQGTPAHAAKFTPSFFRRVKLLVMKVYKARVKAIHLLNVSPFMDAVVSIGKTLIKQQYRDRLIVHRDGYLKGYDSLHAHISPKILPTEYGGEAGSVLDMWDDWKKKIYSYRDWFLNEGALKSDESKRPETATDNSELFGLDGSFRQLDID